MVTGGNSDYHTSLFNPTTMKWSVGPLLKTPRGYQVLLRRHLAAMEFACRAMVAHGACEANSIPRTQHFCHLSRLRGVYKSACKPTTAGHLTNPLPLSCAVHSGHVRRQGLRHRRLLGRRRRRQERRGEHLVQYKLSTLGSQVSDHTDQRRKKQGTVTMRSCLPLTVVSGRHGIMLTDDFSAFSCWSLAGCTERIDSHTTAVGTKQQLAGRSTK